MARQSNQRASQSQQRARDDGYQLRSTERPGREPRKKASGGATKPSSRKKTRAREPSGWAWPSPCYTELPCPACDEPVFLTTVQGRRLFLERQRRLVVFAGPWDTLKVEADETGQETVSLLPREPLTLWEESTDRLVVGRSASAEERDHFSKAARAGGHGLDGLVPWTIGHESHLLHCRQESRWRSGLADFRFASLDADRYGPVFYRLTIAQAEALYRSTGKEPDD